MRLKELIADLENREVEEVSVIGKHNKWVATCELSRLKEAFTNRYLEEKDSEEFSFFGVTYVRIEDEESYIKERLSR